MLVTYPKQSLSACKACYLCFNCYCCISFTFVYTYGYLYRKLLGSHICTLIQASHYYSVPTIFELRYFVFFASFFRVFLLSGSLFGNYLFYQIMDGYQFNSSATKNYNIKQIHLLSDYVHQYEQPFFCVWEYNHTNVWSEKTA